MWSFNTCPKRTRRCSSVSADRSSGPLATWTYPHVDLEESPHPDGSLIKRPVVPLMRAPGTAQRRGVIDSGSPISAANVVLFGTFGIDIDNDPRLYELGLTVSGQFACAPVFEVTPWLHAPTVSDDAVSWRLPLAVRRAARSARLVRPLPNPHRCVDLHGRSGASGRRCLTKRLTNSSIQAGQDRIRWMERHAKCLLNDTRWTGRHAVDGELIAHNPKVVGSNPTLATNGQTSRSKALSDESERALIVRDGASGFRQIGLLATSSLLRAAIGPGVTNRSGACRPPVTWGHLGASDGTASEGSASKGAGARAEAAVPAEGIGEASSPGSSGRS